MLGFITPLNLRDLVGLNGKPDITGSSNGILWDKAEFFPGVAVTNSNVLFIKEEEKCEEETNYLDHAISTPSQLYELTLKGE